MEPKCAVHRPPRGIERPRWRGVRDAMEAYVSLIYRAVMATHRPGNHGTSIPKVVASEESSMLVNGPRIDGSSETAAQSRQRSAIVPSSAADGCPSSQQRDERHVADPETAEAFIQ